MQTSILRIETVPGPPITIQDTQVHVRSQVVQLRVPGIQGGVIWNRPAAVVVRAVDGKENILPIPDVTRAALLTWAGLSFTVLLMQLFFRRKKARS